MSIIYNALQKTQKNLTNRRGMSQERRWIDIALLIIIIFLLVVICFAYFPKFKKNPTKISNSVIQKPVSDGLADRLKSTQIPPSRPNPPPITEIDYQGKLVLNGVFLSQQEKIAMVNNQPMHVGDIVEGKKIISIELNKIKLLDKNNILILRTVS